MCNGRQLQRRRNCGVAAAARASKLPFPKLRSQFNGPDWPDRMRRHAYARGATQRRDVRARAKQTHTHTHRAMVRVRPHYTNVLIINPVSASTHTPTPRLAHQRPATSAVQICIKCHIYAGAPEGGGGEGGSGRLACDDVKCMSRNARRRRHSYLCVCVRVRPLLQWTAVLLMKGNLHVWQRRSAPADVCVCVALVRACVRAEVFAYAHHVPIIQLLHCTRVCAERVGGGGAAATSGEPAHLCRPATAHPLSGNGNA